MNISVRFRNLRQWLLTPLLLPLFWAGCSTTPRVDWNSRIGSYTFDQAVGELGPPDKSAKLTDGTTVAEWVTSRGYWRIPARAYSGMDYYSPYQRYWLHDYDVTRSPDWFRRLTFGPDGKLTAWKRLVK